MSLAAALNGVSKAFLVLPNNEEQRVLEKNFTDAFKAWAKSRGYRISDIDDDHRMVRLFIEKVSAAKK